MERIAESKRSRVKWGNINVVKTFLDACIHEVTINGQENGSLKAMSWKKVREMLKDRHNFSVDSKQMKNYFNGLKGKYRAWLSLKNKTGNKYDQSTNTFNLTDIEWETEIKERKIIGTLRNAPLWFPDLCVQLFDGVKRIPEPKIQKYTMSLVSPSSSIDPVKNKQKMGEESHEPQAALPLVSPSAETSPPLAATETPQKEPMVCSSLVEVPPELPQVQPATTFVTVKTKAEVPTELPEVQPGSAREAMETKAEEPVVPVSTDDSNVVEVTMQMELEESVERTGPGRAFHGPDRALYRLGKDQDGPAVLNMPTFYHPDHTAPGFFRSDIDQALTGPSLDPLHFYKDLQPPSHRCNRHCCCRHQSPQWPMSPPPHVTATPSDMESINEPKRNRVYWNVNIVKTFLDACIHEITINGQEDGSLKAMSWKKVGEVLRDSHYFSVDSKQMKNYFDGLKTKYKAWVSLKNKTGNKYDPSTNTFNLTEKEWETEMKKNKCIEELRKAPLPFPDLCAQLFDGAISAGFFQTSVDQGLTGPEPEPGEITDEPQATVPLVPPSSEKSPPSAATEALVEPQKELIMCNSLVEVPPELPKVQPAIEVVAIETKRTISVFEEEMLGVLKTIADKMNKPEPPPKPTFEDCEKKLNELGWPKDDPLHLVALTIFCDENDNYRELWMKLDPNLCTDWVRMIGRSKRFT